jgi:nucleoside-diphosphate-sugar epimerase
MGRHDGLLNIGSGNERTILQVAEMVKNIVGVSGLEMKHGGVNAIHNRTLDISLLESKFGTIHDNFEENLKETIVWFKENRDLARF